MCIGFWSLDDPTYSLILCANRDEFLDRPTLPAVFHDFVASVPTTPSAEVSSITNGGERAEEGFVLSGIDVKAGGTWLGINKLGGVAFITNITERSTPRAVSRGVLTSSFLKQQPQREDFSILPRYVDYVKSLGSDDVPLDIGGFNLVLFEPQYSPTSTPSAPGRQPSGQVALSYEAILVTNSGAGGPITTRPIGRSPAAAKNVDGGGGDDEEDTETRCGGISNHIDGSTIDGLGSSVPWTKVPRGRQLFSEVLAKHRHNRHSMGMAQNSTTSSPSNETKDNNDADEGLAEDLFALLSTFDTSSTPRTQVELRHSIFIPPFPMLTNAFYGTRLSTVILVRRNSGNVLFIERDRSGMIARGHNGKDDVGGDGDDGGTKHPVPTPVIYDPQTAKLTQRAFRFEIGRRAP